MDFVLIDFVSMVSVLGREPNFDVPIVNVTVVAGQTALLPCSIESLGKYKVSDVKIYFFFIKFKYSKIPTYPNFKDL